MITIKINSPGLPEGHDLTIDEDALFELIKQADLGKQFNLFLKMKEHLQMSQNVILKVLMKNENVNI